MNENSGIAKIKGNIQFLFRRNLTLGYARDIL
jgi:hypothetical protein